MTNDIFSDFDKLVILLFIHSISQHTNIYLYIYIYICMCMYVCTCVYYTHGYTL